MREVHLRTSAPEETRALGAVIAVTLRPGDVVSLTGELGAGKTCLVQGAAAALGVRERVTSPTFLLRRDYKARVPMVHLDIYRLNNLSEVADLADDEVFAADSITFVEWGDAMSPLLPPEHLEVELAVADDLDGVSRSVTLRAHGDDWSRRLAGLRDRLADWTDG